MIDFNLDIDIMAELENISFKSNYSNNIYYISPPVEIILPMVRFPFKKMKNKIKLELENPNRFDIKLQSYLLFYELLTNKFCEKTLNSNINNLLYKNKGYTNLTLYNKNLPYFNFVKSGFLRFSNKFELESEETPEEEMKYLEKHYFPNQPQRKVQANQQMMQQALRDFFTAGNKRS